MISLNLSVAKMHTPAEEMSRPGTPVNVQPLKKPGTDSVPQVPRVQRERNRERSFRTLLGSGYVYPTSRVNHFLFGW